MRRRPVSLLLVMLATLLAAVAAVGASIPFVFGETAGRSYSEGGVSWRDALLRASVGGCKDRLPQGARLRPQIHDCVINQVHVTNTSPHGLECRVTLVFPSPDDDGRTRVEQTIHVEANRERWVATAFGPASLAPESFSSSCGVAARGVAS
ncbi:MAG TPA: hypothetical protein VMF52_03790 [Steroidobacteraceae bacterium]|nr:hypothetical protein [Steroidobacteraceae bacterium]